jgi:hypothetical protein
LLSRVPMPKSKEDIEIENLILRAHSAPTLEDRDQAQTSLTNLLVTKNKEVAIVDGKLKILKKEKKNKVAFSKKFLNNKDLVTLIEDNEFTLPSIENMIAAFLKALVFENARPTSTSAILDAIPSLDEKYLLTSYPCCVSLDVKDMVTQIGNKNFMEFWKNTSSLIKSSVQNSVAQAFKAQYEEFDKSLVGQVVKNKETDFVFIVKDITDGHVMLQDTYEDSSGNILGIDESVSPVRNSTFREEYEYA